MKKTALQLAALLSRYKHISTGTCIQQAFTVKLLLLNQTYVFAKGVHVFLICVVSVKVTFCFTVSSITDVA